MKSGMDPRHLRRIQTMQGLFQFSYTQEAAELGNAKVVIDNIVQIDELVQKAAPEWPIDKLNRVDLAILRQAVHELIMNETPHKVVIDEAVELAKQFGAENSPKFVNGALGAALRQIHPEIEEQTQHNPSHDSTTT